MRKPLTRPLDQADLSDREPFFWPIAGRFCLQETIAPYGRRQNGNYYPAAVKLMVRMGDDRSHLGFDLTWEEAEKLFKEFKAVMERREDFKQAVSKAKAAKVRHKST